MYFKKLKKTALLLLIITGAINTVSAQIVRKVGDNPFTIDKRAALEVESTTKGFLPPRMTRIQRDAIDKPAEGLLVWCSDCNKSTEPVSGELCAWTGSAWIPVAMPVKNYEVIIDGTAVASILGIDPISKQLKIGVDSNSTITVYFDVTKAGTYNFTFDSVTGLTTGLKIPKVSGSWSSTGKQPVTFTIEGTPATSLEGNSFAGSGMTKPLSTGAILADDITGGTAVVTSFKQDAILKPLKIGEASVDNYIRVHFNVTKPGNYESFLIGKISGATQGLSMPDVPAGTFSKTGDQSLDFKVEGKPDTSTDGKTFTVIRIGDLRTGRILPSPVTGGTAVAELGIIELSKPIKMGEASSSVFKVHFSVSKTGSYDGFKLTETKGKTKGLSIDPLPGGGTFSTIGDHIIEFPVIGTPDISLDGNSFVMSRIGELNTGAIVPDPITGGTAIATLGTIELSKKLTFGEVSKSVFKVPFNVSKTGSYDSFVLKSTAGETTGISIADYPAGTFSTTGEHIIEFTVTGTPDTSLEGNIFDMLRIGKLNTGKILPNPVTGGMAVATLDKTELSEQLRIGKNSNSFFKVYLNVTKTGTYDSFVPVIKIPAADGDYTKGITLSPVQAGVFSTTGPVIIKFEINGTPTSSLEGVTFEVPRIGAVSTGKILPDPITGGTAVATVTSVEKLAAVTLVEDSVTGTPFKIGEAGSGSIKVNFNVSSPGSYESFAVETTNGKTTGLSMASVPAGNFDIGNQSLTFAVSGTPEDSVDGNSFAVSRIVTPLSTGKIVPFAAICDGTVPTAVVPVISKTGQTWMDRNLGASRMAASSDDYKAFGCLYQWGRGNDGHASINWVSGTAGTPANSTTAVKSGRDIPEDALFITSGTEWRSGVNTELWQGLSGTNNPCPSGYRVPTNEEFVIETTAYSMTSTTEAFESPFKFTRNGLRDRTGKGNLSNVNSRAYYWTSTLSSLPDNSSLDFSFDDAAVNSSDTKAHTYGISVRCIKDEPKNPITGGMAIATIGEIKLSKQLRIGEESTSAFEVHFDVTKPGYYDSFVVEDPTGATTGLSVATVPGGIFTGNGDQVIRFAVNGKPGTSLKGNSFAASRIGTLNTGTILDKEPNGEAICKGVKSTTTIVEVKSKTGATWMDRNLGASRVAKSATDYMAFGCLFQWGRGNDGHASIKWTSGTEGTPVNGSTGDLSNGDSPADALFIIGKDEWRSKANPQLWQGVSGTNNPCPSSYRLPTNAEFVSEVAANTIANTAEDYDKSSLKLKFARSGRRSSSDGNLSDAGNAYYWTSTLSPPTSVLPIPVSSSVFSFNAAVANDYDSSVHANGLSVRCIKDITNDPVTGGYAEATVSRIERISSQPEIYKPFKGEIIVHLDVTTPGSYGSFVVEAIEGDTTGLDMATVPAGNFSTTGDHAFHFIITGTPDSSLDGDSFVVSRIGKLKTGEIAPDPVTGGLAVATLGEIEKISSPPQIGVRGWAADIKVHFNVTKTGSHSSFVPEAPTDDTKGLSMITVPAGSFDTTGDQILPFTVYGSPYAYASLKGNSFKVPRIGTLSTGKLLPDLVTGGSAVATVLHTPRGNKISSAPQIGIAGKGIIDVYFDVTNTGTFDSFVPEIVSSSTATTGLSMATVSAGDFTAGYRTLGFEVTGTPYASLDGTSFTIPRIGTLWTGPVLPDAVTGGTAVATVASVEALEAEGEIPLRIGKKGKGTIKVYFNVTTKGTYDSFEPQEQNLGYPNHATQGLSMATVPAGKFTETGHQSLTFTVSGTPTYSLNGYPFKVSRIEKTLNTGTIEPFAAICDGTVSTEVVEVTSKTGRIWMDRNLGASRAATSSDDYQAAGCRYQWGRGNDGHASWYWGMVDVRKGLNGKPANGTTYKKFDVDTPDSSLTVVLPPDDNWYNVGYYWQTTPNPNLWQGVDGINNPCPTDYRLPTKKEITDEITIYSIIGESSAYATPLKFVANFLRIYSLFDDYGYFNGEYWSSTCGDYNRKIAPNYVQFTSYGNSQLSYVFNEPDQTSSKGVRCIKDERGVTGGTAVATLGTIETIKVPFTIGSKDSRIIKVHLNVTKPGTYAGFSVKRTSGGTTGLSIDTVPGGNYDTTGDKIIEFTVKGSPETSIEGNSFVISRITTPLETGAILPFKAVCDGSVSTAVVDILSKTGKYWMDRNLGASKVADSIKDYKAFGCLYQWGRGNDGHASINWASDKAGEAANTGTTIKKAAGNSPGNDLFITGVSEWRSDTSTQLWQGLSGINNPCPSGYRLPTNAEFVAEVAAYTITNSAEAFKAPFKFTKNGRRNLYGGDLSDFGRAYYWSSTPSSVNVTNSLDFFFDDSSVNASDSNAHAHGLSVRCIKN